MKSVHTKAPITFLAALFLSLHPAFAGTTGTVSVRVVDIRNAPVAAARVEATSPSQNERGVTDAGGFVGLVNLSPDTYTLTVTRDGFNTLTIYGVTVQADQTTSVRVTLQPSIKLLGRVSVRENQTLVNRSVTGDLYSVNAQALTRYAGSMGGGETLYSNYSAMSSQPGVVRSIGIGGGYYGANTISVRGGSPDQVGYELDGVPLNRAYDKAQGSSFSTNGLESMQLYTGGEPAYAGRSMSGYVNMVANRGSYPGGGDITGYVGGPVFNHTVQADIYGGTPNGDFSYYVSTLAVNSAYRFGNASNLDNTGISIPAGDPGCAYVNFLNGTSLNCGQPHFFNLPISQAVAQIYTAPYATIRNTIANFHFGIHHGDLTDDVQALYSSDYSGNPFNYSGPTLDPRLADMTNADHQIIWPFGQLYTGSIGQPYNPSAFKTLTWPSAGGSTGPVPAWYLDGQTQQSSVSKLSYTRSFSPSAFLQVYGYSLYSLWTFDQATNPYIGGIYYVLRNNTNGATATYENQVSEHNLLRADLDYTKQVGLVYSYSPNFFSDGGNVTCGNLALGPAGIVPCAVGETVAQIGAPSHVWNDLPEGDWDVALTDKWHPNDRLTADLGVRFDSFTQGLTPLQITGPNGIAEQGQNSVGQCLDGYAYPATQPCFGYLTALGGSASPGAADWQNVSGTLNFNSYSPRVGLTYTMDPSDVLRFAVGRYVEPPNLSYQEYVGAPWWGVGGTIAQLNNYYQGFGLLAVHHVLPEDSTNYDFSYEHQFNAAWSIKVSPFYRVTRNQILNAPSPTQIELETGFNYGSARNQGVEFLLGRNRTTPDGLDVTLAATYNDAKLRFNRTIGNRSFIDTINTAISTYNAAYGTHYSLFDPNGYYSPSATESPNFMTPSYDVPWVVNLALDERIQHWDLYPTFNFQTGAPYGDPLMFPDTGVHNLAVGPDPYTKTFDGFGSLIGPQWLTMNLGISRDLGQNTKATALVTNLFTSIWNHGYPWEFAPKYQVLEYADNNYYRAEQLPADPYLGENYFPYSPWSINNATQLTFEVSVKI
jgi:TonB dependent receptor/Carboxypeptidase regulatory-like domain/TonB-dependent Receptor Plug Domain